MNCDRCSIELIDVKRYVNDIGIPISIENYNINGGMVLCQDCFNNLMENRWNKDRCVLSHKYFEKYYMDLDFRQYAFNLLNTNVNVLNQIKSSLLKDNIDKTLFDKYFTLVLPKICENLNYLNIIAKDSIDFLNLDKNIDLSDEDISLEEQQKLHKYIMSIDTNNVEDFDKLNQDLLVKFGGRILRVYNSGLWECGVFLPKRITAVYNPSAYVTINNKVYMLQCGIYGEDLNIFINNIRRVNTKDVKIRCEYSS